MRKIRKSVIMLFIACVVFGSNIVSNAAEAEPEEQEYYLLYMMDADSNMVIEVGRREVILEQSDYNINLYNLTLFPLETGVFHPFQMVDLETAELTREVREYLLYAGYARINDESIAEEYEIEAQEHAKSNSLGGWNIEASDELEEVLVEKADRAQEEYIEGVESTHTQKEETEKREEAQQGEEKREEDQQEEQQENMLEEEKRKEEKQGEEEKRKEEKQEEQSEKEQREEEQQEKDIKIMISKIENWINEHPVISIICVIVFLIVVGVIRGMRRARHRY